MYPSVTLKAHTQLLQVPCLHEVNIPKYTTIFIVPVPTEMIVCKHESITTGSEVIVFMPVFISLAVL